MRSCETVTYRRHGDNRCELPYIPALFGSIALAVHKTRTITDLCNAYGNHVKHKRVLGSLSLSRDFPRLRWRPRKIVFKWRARVSDTRRRAGALREGHVKINMKTTNTVDIDATTTGAQCLTLLYFVLLPSSRGFAKKSPRARSESRETKSTNELYN